jgi:YjbR protein
MGADDFRRLALGMSDAIEGEHMGHPDFRVQGRIFATIHHDQRNGMVKLTPEQQERFVAESPGAFAPESGAWGRQGCTRVRFDAADEEIVGDAMTLAWQNTVTNGPKTKSTPTRRTRAKR